MSPRRLILLLALPAALAGCGGGEQTADIPSADAPAGATETETETETTEASKPGKPTAATRAIAAKVGEDVERKPRIAKPKGDPPAELVIHDVVEGSGAAAKDGDQVTVDYAGVSWSTGEEFDASWGKGKQDFPFALGGGQVIPGWDQGVAGMKKGGRRLLVIPPDLAYGAQGSPPSIGPDETLVFVVDLREIG